jgi:hypothetical protein
MKIVASIWQISTLNISDDSGKRLQVKCIE